MRLNRSHGRPTVYVERETIGVSRELRGRCCLKIGANCDYDRATPLPWSIQRRSANDSLRQHCTSGYPTDRDLAATVSSLTKHVP